jgi:hypothetical protein
MIRDLVERNLSRLKLQTDDHDEVVDVVTRVIGAAADDAVRDLMKRRSPPAPDAAEDPDDNPTDDADQTVTGDGRRARSSKFAK